MDDLDWTTIAVSTLTSIGGGVIFLRLFGEFLFSKQIERHKTRLRKSEFLFQKEFEAASTFISLLQQLIPRYRRPDMEWYDVCEDFAENFEQVEKDLGSYIAVHGAALESETLKRLSHAQFRASEGKFKVDHNGNVYVEGIKDAEEVIDALKKVEEELYQTIRLQSGTKTVWSRAYTILKLIRRD